MRYCQGRFIADLGRHECNRSLDHERRRPLHLTTPSEQHVGVQVVTTRHHRHRSSRLKCLRNDPPLVIRRPSSSTPAVTPDCRPLLTLQHRHRPSCPLALSGHDHRATLHANIPEPLTARPGGPHRRDTNHATGRRQIYPPRCKVLIVGHGLSKLPDFRLESPRARAFTVVSVAVSACVKLDSDGKARQCRRR